MQGFSSRSRHHGPPPQRLLLEQPPSSTPAPLLRLSISRAEPAETALPLPVNPMMDFNSISWLPLFSSLFSAVYSFPLVLPLCFFHHLPSLLFPPFSSCFFPPFSFPGCPSAPLVSPAVVLPLSTPRSPPPAPGTMAGQYWPRAHRGHLRSKPHCTWAA